MEFSAQVYDESFNPVNEAIINLNIKTGDYKEELNLTSVGDGLYEGSFSTIKTEIIFSKEPQLLMANILGKTKVPLMLVMLK